ncbi:MAG: PilZ domain-containing protein [Candidatus Acidiferrales bacterium]
MLPKPTPNATRLRSGAALHDERRRFARYAISAVAQIADPRSGARLTARVSDLGWGGCYVDTLAPLPVGTQVHVSLRKEKSAIELTGKIVYANPGLGMGIAFVGAAAEHKEALKKWLNSLSQGQPSGDSIRTPVPAARRTPTATAGPDDARSCVARLVHLLVAKGLLTEDDAEMILNKRPSVL